MPTVRLSNGLLIGNFSSPHPFEFVDGSVLPACDPDRSKFAQLDAVEYITTEEIRGVGVDIISLKFLMTEPLRAELEAAKASEADVVLIPFPVMNAAKEAGMEIGKLATIRNADRITKKIYCDRFCR